MGGSLSNPASVVKKTLEQFETKYDSDHPGKSTEDPGVTNVKSAIYELLHGPEYDAPSFTEYLQNNIQEGGELKEVDDGVLALLTYNTNYVLDADLYDKLEGILSRYPAVGCSMDEYHKLFKSVIYTILSAVPNKTKFQQTKGAFRPISGGNDNNGSALMILVVLALLMIVYSMYSEYAMLIIGATGLVCGVYVLMVVR